MKCTSCNRGELLPAHLEPMFPCHTCNHCGGHWVYLRDYSDWLSYAEATYGKPLNGRYHKPYNVDADDTERVMICPVTHNLMLKYRICKASEHRLDLSSAAKAVWMDCGEWQLIKEQGLADRLPEVFTEHWQREIREALAHDVFDGMYQQRFGEDAYRKVQEIRDWLDQQDIRQSLVAYLAADNPYSANR